MSFDFVSSVNPYTREKINQYYFQSISEVDLLIENTSKKQRLFSQISVSQRIEYLYEVEKLLLDQKEICARLISSEMGKPIRQSRAEIEKCAWLCQYYAKNGAAFLSDELIETEASRSFVRNEPIGLVLAIMPWNFPFWQVFRCAIPALLSGNAVLLKHASNVFGCALAIENLFERTGFGGCLKCLIIGSDKVSQVVQNQNIRAISLTGSDSAGKAVATCAGKHIKKLVLELGGSNSFIVDESVQLEDVIYHAINSRFQNNGQSCIASKRFLVHESIAEKFTELFLISVSKLVVGDPFDELTDIGPLAKPSFNDDLSLQIEHSVQMGAKVHCGAKLNGDGIFLPTVLSNVQPGMPVFSEETFGPVAAICTFSDIEEAIDLHERSRYGLGVSIFTRKVNEWMPLVGKFSDGAVFFNSMVKSDPRLPFGGTKDSGYGRELGRDGVMEFVNRKTVYIT